MGARVEFKTLAQAFMFSHEQHLDTEGIEGYNISFLALKQGTVYPTLQHLSWTCQ